MPPPTVISESCFVAASSVETVIFSEITEETRISVSMYGSMSLIFFFSLRVKGRLSKNEEIAQAITKAKQAPSSKVSHIG